MLEKESLSGTMALKLGSASLVIRCDLPSHSCLYTRLLIGLDSNTYHLINDGISDALNNPHSRVLIVTETKRKPHWNDSN